MNMGDNWNERMCTLIATLTAKIIPTPDIDYSKRSIESLVRRLKDDKASQKHILLAVNSEGQQPSGCVKIQKSMDGRLQVSGRKGFPHIMYAKIFRWPDLQRGELRHLDICQWPYDSKLDYVCVNPYHYERVTIGLNQMRPSHSSTNNSYNNHPRIDPYPFPDQSFFPQYDHQMNVPQSQPIPNHSLPYTTYSSQSLYTTIYNKYRHALTLNDDMEWCRAKYFEYNHQVGDQFNAVSTIYTFRVDGYINCVDIARFSVGMFVNEQRDAKTKNLRNFIGKGFTISRHSDSIFIKNVSDRPLFFKAPYEFNEDSTIVKLYPETETPIYNLSQQFDNVMNELMNYTGNEPHSIPSLRLEMTKIVVSFNKGWGCDYYRKSITDCPCWIELQIGSGLEFITSVKTFLKTLNRRA